MVQHVLDALMALTPKNALSFYTGFVYFWLLKLAAPFTGSQEVLYLLLPSRTSLPSRYMAART